ncbi:hypothetical protein D4N06_20555 [Klebsiella pneumoniae]|mgnify:CR=1 FL=1|nr:MULTISPECIES: hypothetical protein [Klebsiella]AVO98621.1 hypothetical protein AM475_28115 [Klebsiella pneumoniae subsp. ozaenae]ELA1890885.1 hypothetical protein [Klebsiella aerogenes]MBV7689941.1 hypothetical protein [Klebsiella quasipneumoniae subsp. similipneumoniae]AXZ16909.1 hypothetical protein AM476_01360 [Klebsiella pneumoniae]EGF63031.1 hypothetical protein HMPREF9538_02577 [Klebsiella sp. MS 92-3]
MKMGDLAKKPQAAEEVSQSTESEVKQPMRSPTRPQGRPTRGKSSIKSRTMSIEDEFISLISVMENVDRWNRFTRSDVIRAAIMNLASESPERIAETIAVLRETPASEAEMRGEQIRRELEQKQ